MLSERMLVTWWSKTFNLILSELKKNNTQINLAVFLRGREKEQMETKDINTKMGYTDLSVYIMSLSINGPISNERERASDWLKKLKLKVKKPRLNCILSI